MNYLIQIEDPDKLLVAFLRADKKARRTFLRQFITLDGKALAQYARETKDPAKFMKEIPGVKCWSE